MKNRFEVLDIFRGLFSAMVVFFHMSAFSATPIINNNFVYNSDLFVDFFFVLSGFVISYSYQSIQNENQVKSFLKKRFFRIYPLHLIMLMAFVFIELVKHLFEGHIQINNLNNPNNNLTSFISSFVLMNSVKMPNVTDVSWNIPSWSISAEMISYIVFALVVLLIWKAKWFNYRNYIFIILVALSGAALLGINGNLKITYSFDYGFLRGIIGFFTGVLCFNTFNYSKNYFRSLPIPIFHIAEALIITAIAYFVYQKRFFENLGLIYELIFFLAVLIFSFEKGFISSMLTKSGFLKRMGTYSYSIYMTHALLLSIFNIVFIRVLKLPPSAYSYLFILNYYLIFKVSEWTYRNIEMRFIFKKKSKTAYETKDAESYADKVLATQR